MHVEENGSSEEGERSMNAFRVSPQEDECGIDEGQRSLLIERFGFSLTTERAANQSILPPLDHHLVYHRRPRQSTSDPPWDRYLALRI